MTKRKPRPLILLLLALAVIGKSWWKPLSHNQLGAPAWTVPNQELVHEGAHQEDAASRGAEQVLFRERVRHFGQLKALPLVENPNNHFVGIELDGHVDFLVPVMLVAVVVGVDDAFANGHADFVHVVIVEACSFGNAHDDAFGEVDAFEQSLQRDLDALGCGRHPESREPLGNAVYGYHSQRARVNEVPNTLDANPDFCTALKRAAGFSLAE
jgi:hypothetical protein